MQSTAAKSLQTESIPPVPRLIVYSKLTDSELVDKATNGDGRALDALVERYAPRVNRLASQLMGDLEAYSMRSGTERVIGFLLDRCTDSLPNDGEADVTLPTTKGVIASRLSLTQEHFSRILHELSSSGLIQVRGRTVRIVDVGRLRASGGYASPPSGASGGMRMQ